MSPLDRFILDNEALPEKDRLSGRQIAKKFDVDEATVRRHKKALNVKANPDTMRDDFFNIPTGIITKRGITKRLEDGSYEKVEFRPGAIEMLEAQQTSYEDLAAVFDRVFPAPAVDEEVKKPALIVSLSDFQIGKTDTDGNHTDTVERVTKMLGDLEQSLIVDGVRDEIIIAEVGDLIEGFNNVVSQAQTNSLSLTDQIRVAQRLIAEIIARVSPWAKRVTYVSVPSNHCMVRTGVGSSNRANAPDDDFGLLVADNLEMALEGRPQYKHVRFVRPAKWEEAITVQLDDGSHVAFTHGHQVKNQNGMADWFAKMAFGRRSGLHMADVLLHGHFHNFSLKLTGDMRWIVSAPTVDNGSSWFSNVSGNRTDPALLTFEVTNGRAQNWRLYYV